MNARAPAFATQLALVLALALAGCGSSSGGSGREDAGAGDTSARDAASGQDAAGNADADPNAPAIEIGTGETAFISLVENGPIDLQRGPQGGSRYFGFHIWSAVRANNLDPSEIAVRFTVTTTTGEMLSESPYRLNLEPAQGGDVAVGLRMILDDCCKAEGRPLIMRAEATDRNGVTAEDDRTVMAPAECPRGLPNPTIDPCP